MIEQLHGTGTIEKRIPAMLRMYMNYDIDMRKQPILVYPTLHYQNGGLEIGGDGFTKLSLSGSAHKSDPCRKPGMCQLDSA